MEKAYEFGDGITRVAKYGDGFVFTGTGMFSIVGHVEVLGILLNSDSYEDALPKLEALGRRKGTSEATDTAVRDAVWSYYQERR